MVEAGFEPRHAVRGYRSIHPPPKKVKTTLGVIPASGDRIREEAGVLGLYDATKRQVEESITFALAGLERLSVPK